MESIKEKKYIYALAILLTICSITFLMLATAINDFMKTTNDIGTTVNDLNHRITEVQVNCKTNSGVTR